MKQTSLFSDNESAHLEHLPDATIRYYAEALKSSQADDCFNRLLEELNWHQERITLFGKTSLSPRLQAWHGDTTATYQYSGLRLTPQPWTATLTELKQCCERLTNTQFNSVLANLYRDGQDAMGWHSDDEPELGRQPVIASMTLGTPRRFDLKHKHTEQKAQIMLAHGSVLVMSGLTQQYWRHGIARTTKVTTPRINLTFRFIKT